MTEDEGRAAVIAEALTWTGTPFRDNARIKGAGCDCINLVIAAFLNTGIIEDPKVEKYPPRWHLHRSEERLLNGVMRFAVDTGEVKRGNVILYREGRCFSHCGIITGDLNLVHASWRRGWVIVSPLHQSDLMFMTDRANTPRPQKIFDVWAKRAAAS
jgi:cell wall-associated NlpC family hydrolase